MSNSIFVDLAATFQSLPLIWQVVLPFVLFSVSWSAYNYFFHPLAKFPGPLSARVGLPIWQFWHAYKREYVWALEALHDKHGAIVRIGPNHLSLTSSDAVQGIYAHGGKYDKTTFYQSFQVYAKHPSLFSDIDPKSHADRRRAVSAAYSMNSLVSLEQYVEPLIRSLMQQMRSRMAQVDEKSRSTLMDMSKWMHYFAMDAVGELAFGQSFGFVHHGSDPDDFLVGVSNLSHWGSMAGWLPSLSQPLRKLLQYSSGEPNGAVVGSATKPLIDARYRAIAQQRAEGKTEAEDDEIRSDLLSKFIKAKDPATGKIFNPQQVLLTAISVVGAGSDTTSVALTAFFGYLVRHPAIYAAVQKEIDEAFDGGLVRKPVSYAAGVKLLLTQACIKETLRLHPPISMSLPRLVGKEGAVIDGHFLPGGTQVSVSPYVFHRTEQAYGSDARQWNPYRWLNLTDEQRRHLERNNLTFGGGSRQCIGKNISLMELSKVLPSLLRAFSFAVPSMSSTSYSEDSNVTRVNHDLCRRRDADGTFSDDVPWTCQSTWFLDAKDLVLEVTERVVDDEEDDD